MIINNRLVSEFIDKATPYIKKGVKKLEAVNERYFKPTEETAKEFIEKIEVQGAEYNEVAPFAQRLIQPEIFGMNPAINRLRATVRNTRKMLSQAKDEKVKECFSNIYDRILDESSNVEVLSDSIVTLMQKTDMIENPKIKYSITSYINSFAKQPKKAFQENFQEKMLFMEEFADAANTIGGKYLRTDSEPVEFYKWMKKNNIWLLDVIENTKKGEDTYRRKMLTHNGNKTYEHYLKGYEKYSKQKYSETFQNDLRANSIREFIHEYYQDYPKAVDFLYKEEFLKTLPEEVATECGEIYKTYGTYVIPTNANITAKDMQYLKEELNLWQQAGEGMERLPKTIDVDTLNRYMLEENASGYAELCTKNIHVRDLLVYDGLKDSVGSTLRHEIQHLQDFDTMIPKNTLEHFRYKFKWIMNKLVHKRQWKQELKNGGISDNGLIQYALTEPAELRSVTAETDMKKLSEGYKEFLNKDYGMQKWIFKLKDNKVLKDSRRNDLAKSLTEEALKNIEK